MKVGSLLAAGKRKGCGGERTGPWARKKLNWTGANQLSRARETEKKERNGLPGKRPSSLLYMGCKSVLLHLRLMPTHILTLAHMI